MREFFSRQNVFIYIALSFIVIVCFLLFYISCKSKSPTESSSVLNGQVLNQSTNNTTQTTSSSSTTTTIKPGNSPTNTTTLITSRNLTSTTTSTSTSTTSIPTTTTTIGYIKLEWCSVTANGQEIANGDKVYISGPDPFKPVDTIIGISVRNVGNTPAENLKFTLTQLYSPMSVASILDGFNNIKFINENGKCENSPQAFLVRTRVITSISKFKIQGEYGLPPFYFEIIR